MLYFGYVLQAAAFFPLLCFHSSMSKWWFPTSRLLVKLDLSSMLLCLATADTVLLFDVLVKFLSARTFSIARNSYGLLYDAAQ